MKSIVSVGTNEALRPMAFLRNEFPILPANTDVQLIADALLNAGEGVYGGAEGRGGLFRCPVHDDGDRPNLNLAVGDQVPYLVTCQVCLDSYSSAEFRDLVFEAIGLNSPLPGLAPSDGDVVDWGPRSDVGPSGPTSSEPSWNNIPADWKQLKVATYEYPNLDGTPKARVVRDEAFDPTTEKRIAKRVRPWHFNAGASPSQSNAEARAWEERGYWRWKLGWGDSERTPMNWSDRPTWQGEIVHITEGEKDAKRLSDLGLFATTYPFGTFPRDVETLREHLGELRGVFVYGDYDKAGFDKAVRRVRLLKEAGYRVRTRFVDPQRFESIRGAGTAVKADVSDWLDAGLKADEMVTMDKAREAFRASVEPARMSSQFTGVKGHRQLVAIPLDTIAPQSVEWVWADLIPVGELTLLAGRQGIGKSSAAYDIASRLTRGTLPGQYHGEPRTVLIVATEDSTEHTIVPRLIAAGADRTRILQIIVRRADGQEGVLDLSSDLVGLSALLDEHDPVLMILDPLVSRLGSKDTHKDAEVRQALEPVVSLAHRHSCAVLGLIHLNKSASTDPLVLVMGSVAFTAIARSVLFASSDPDSVGRVLLGQVKTNLGPLRIGTMSYVVESFTIAGHHEASAKIQTSRIVWGQDDQRSIGDLIQSHRRAVRGATIAEQTGEWITQFLGAREGRETSLADLLEAASADGWSRDQINKGCRMLRDDGAIETRRAAEKGGPAIWKLADCRSDDGEAF